MLKKDWAYLNHKRPGDRDNMNTVNYFGKTKPLLSGQITLNVKRNLSQYFIKSDPMVQENFVLLTLRKPNSNFVPVYI